MSDVELAESITSLLPAEYQGRMVFCLSRLKRACTDDQPYCPVKCERVFKQFTVFLHLNLYPKRKEYWDLADESYDYWREWADGILEMLHRKKQVVS